MKTTKQNLIKGLAATLFAAAALLPAPAAHTSYNGYVSAFVVRSGS